MKSGRAWVAQSVRRRPSAQVMISRLLGLSPMSGSLLSESACPSPTASPPAYALSWDAWVAQSVKHLPSAQVMLPGSWDRTPHWAPCSAGSLLLPLPQPLPLACALSHTL